MLVGQKAVSAIPEETNPLELLHTYQMLLLKGLRLHLKKFGDTIHLDLSAMIDQIDAIDSKKRISPAIYGIYAQIQTFYAAKDMEGLFHVIQRLKNEISHGLYADTLTTSSFLSEPWEGYIIGDLKETIPESAEPWEKNLFPLIHWNASNFPPAEMTTALDYLQDLDKALHQEFITYVSRFKFFTSKKILTCTSAKFFGAIYMRPFQESGDPISYYLDSITHEVSHLHLYAMMGLDPMIMNDPKELFSSALRPDPRPMYGVFHAGFVLARMVRILRRFQKQGGNVASLLAQKEMKFQETCAVIAEKAKLTSIGKELYLSFESCAFEH